MKIAYITRARMPTEKAHGLQIAKMCEAYALLGHDVELVVPYRKNTIQETIQAYYGLKKEFPVRIISIPDTIVFSKWLPSFAYWLQAFLFVLKLGSRTLSKDTVIMTRSPDVAWWYGKKGYTVVCEVHDVPKAHHSLFAFFLRRATHIICNSKGTAEKVSNMGLTNVVVLPNGVDIDALRPTLSREEMREKLGIAQEAFVALYAGAFEEWKGYQTVLDASEKLKNMVVVMLGGKPDQVSSLKEKYPHVLFLGTTPYRELGNYQNIADVLLIPNDPRFKEDQENTSPIKLFAHLASGIPVIATDLSSIRNIAGDNEIFFFTGDSKSLTERIEYVRSHTEEAKEKGREAHELAQTHTWTRRGERILALTTVL